MRFLVMRLVYNVQSLIHSPKSNFAGYYSINDSDIFKSDIANDCDELQVINNEVMVSRGSYLSQAHNELYVLPTIDISSQVSDGGTLKVTSSKMSLWNAVKIFLANARAVQASSLDDIVNTSPYVYFVLENGIGSLFTNLNTSAFMYDTVCENYVERMYIVLLAITLVSILSMFFVIVFFVKPTVWLIEGI